MYFVLDGILLPKSDVLSRDDPRVVPKKDTPRESDSSDEEVGCDKNGYEIVDGRSRI